MNNFITNWEDILKLYNNIYEKDSIAAELIKGNLELARMKQRLANLHFQMQQINALLYADNATSNMFEVNLIIRQMGIDADIIMAIIRLLNCLDDLIKTKAKSKFEIIEIKKEK